MAGSPERSTNQPLSTERKDGVVAVGLKEKAADAKDLLPWKISVPEFLPKA